MIYYKSKLAIVRTSVEEDIKYIAENMRKEDKKEIWCSHHRRPKDALWAGLKESIICLTVERKGRPIAMFGINPESILGDSAVIWFLASNKLDEIQIAFLKYSRKFINMFLEYYPILNNYVSCESRKTIKWLKFCKAEFGIAVPYGVEQQPFLPFKFRRDK